MSVARGLPDGTETDEGTHIIATVLRLTVRDRDAFLAHGYTMTLTCAPQTHDAGISATLTQLIDGTADLNNAITGTFATGEDHRLTLTVTNGYETAAAVAQIPKTFVNLHLAGLSTGGARFGGFSTSTEGKPKFECDYPAYFYGGIAGLPIIRAGVITIPGSISAGSIVTRTGFTFDEPFPDGCAVSVLLNPQFGNNAIFGGVAFSARDFTVSGFSVRVANNSGSNIGNDVTANYIAIGYPVSE